MKWCSAKVRLSRCHCRASWPTVKNVIRRCVSCSSSRVIRQVDRPNKVVTVGPAILPLKGKILNVEKARLDKMLSSQEIVTLITALGCGVGDSKDMAKLRYHRIVIMTDADVDGSHIRTLLLTFFYRQYKELLDGSLDRKHFIYIAQPPLYKVKKGSREEYLKNDQALEEYLLRSTAEDLVFESQDGKLQVTGDKLRELWRLVGRYARALSACDKKWDSRIVEALLHVGELQVSSLREEEAVQAALGRAEEKLKQHFFRRDRPASAAFARCRTWNDSGGDSGALWRARRETVVDFALFTSPEYAELGRIYDRLRQFGHGPFVLVDGSNRHNVARLSELASVLDTIGRKGLQIQRYKGLGEMTAEQLWETTMDPARRTLLEVHVDDLNEAERLFSMLMGEAVEPRREFIEQHAPPGPQPRRLSAPSSIFTFPMSESTPSTAAAKVGSALYRYAESEIPTVHGNLRLLVYRHVQKTKALRR